MSSDLRRSPLWSVLGLLVVGFVAWIVLKFVVSLIFYVLVGAVVVGAVIWLSGKGRRALRGSDRRSIDD
jgi:hypothetical protein